jgi:hypothetical protein
MLVTTIAPAKILDLRDKTLDLCVVAVPDCGVVGLAELPKSKYNFKA